MCGIVLVGSSQFISFQEKGLFENLLYMDVIRGVHGTGVIAGYNFPEKAENYAIMGKSGTPAVDFLRSDKWKHVSEQGYSNSFGTVFKKQPYFMVGHNRHATRGAKTEENSHPFVHGDVTLVHNGTITNQSRLPDHTKFEVDSNNICYSINKLGAAETIQNLQGAYTLIWHDNRDKTLNIIRNSERPFHLAKTTTGTWFGASEEEMLMWILQRDDKYSFSKSSPKIEKHFECEVGTQYVFDVSGGSFYLKEEIKHTLPVFPAPVYSGYSSWGYDKDDYDYDYMRTRNRRQTTQKSHVFVNSNELITQAKIKEKVGERITFEGLEFNPYPGKPSQGRLGGWIPELEEFVEVQSHVFEASEFKEGQQYSGVIVSAYAMNGVKTLIVKEVLTDDTKKTQP